MRSKQFLGAGPFGLQRSGFRVNLMHSVTSSGKQTASSGSLTNPFQYTGREFDTETGLYYYRARYYDPSTGRFLSEDPIGFSGVDNSAGRANADIYNRGHSGFRMR